MKKLILLLLIVPMMSVGQTKEELELCFFAQTNSFSSDNEADNALDRILGVIGASKNFVLTPCSEINNALATSYKGIRYILYDKAFMRLINSRTNDWSSLTILAQEVGHHINGHALDLTMYAGGVVEAKSLAAKRKQELEADEFAGFIMAKLGAPLNQVESAIALISSDKDDTYSTHPSKSKRLNAVRKGYNKAGGTSRVNNDYVVDNSTISIEEYYNRGKKRLDSKDYYVAIQDFDQAIRLKPDYELAYFYRAWSKGESQDYSGAIADYSRYIESNPSDAAAYLNRGILKKYLNDYYGAIADYTEAIELDPNLAGAYFSRGVAKRRLKEYYGAIADYTKAIELDPNYANAYNNRGVAKQYLKDFYGAIADCTKAIEINPNDALAYGNRGRAKGKLEDHYGAIADFTKAIEINPNNALVYINRGRAKANLKDIKGCCYDLIKSINLGSTQNVDWVRKNCN
tara:strand:- start:146 stop:1525 length:1380 start_codon:yes stop_codon:yes gene_type:complete